MAYTSMKPQMADSAADTPAGYGSASSSPSLASSGPTSATDSGAEEDRCRPVILSHQGTLVTLQIPSESHKSLSKLRKDFASHLAQSGFTTESEAALAAAFTQYASRHCQGKQEKQDILWAFERRFLTRSDIHTVASHAAPADERQILSCFYEAAAAASRCNELAPSSALLKAAAKGKAKIMMAFGGQGSANQACVDEISAVNNLYSPLIKHLIDPISHLLERLSSSPEYVSCFKAQPIRLQSWLRNPSQAPSKTLLATAPYSVPLVGLSGLAHYAATCKILGYSPGQLRERLAGTTGHSQGIAVAAVVSAADSWESFIKLSMTVIETLFYIGVFAHSAAPVSALTHQQIDSSIEHTEGVPSWLLSVRGLGLSKLQDIVSHVNAKLNTEEQIHVALVNAPTNIVLSGPQSSLCGLNNYLRSIKATKDEAQQRIVFDKRKPIIMNQFLAVSAPFHTPYLSLAAESVKELVSSHQLLTSQLALPLLHTRDGMDVRSMPTPTRLLEVLVDAIMVNFANWPASITSAKYTHAITYGAGKIGDLAHQVLDGHGTHVISASQLGRPSDHGIGCKSDVFAPLLPSSSLRQASWAERFGPRLDRSPDGNLTVSTKLTRLLGTPHVTVAAMTPTTVHWDVVSAVMNAGYHAELAGGGYYNAATMSAAIDKLVSSIPPGRGITCNLIYASPKSMAWQIPMLSRLVRQGTPIDGLSIGAGVPSLNVIRTYIESLNLQHMTLKPGSQDSIKQVLEVADAFPRFAIILQWTGGRGGGHHSYEDFHGPILELYSEIRRRENIVLVAGSGFGGATDTWPYLSGSWAVEFGRPEMPFDGVMMGSRMMVAKEAHTSQQAKQLICEAPGVDSNAWTSSYHKATGGVMTVKSEMGEPIHKLATRGVLFWAEMDKIFALPREKMAEQIQSKKEYIIKRLNADFAKPFFGRSASGDIAELADMTYLDVIARLISLMFVSHQSRWIDETWEALALDFIQRAVERVSQEDNADALPSRLPHPFSYLASLQSTHPTLATTLLDPDDEAWFIQRCRQPGTKPVNFVPVVDINLEHWMKKDSLWQSEDVDAVHEQDVQRVCILQGPVAARFSTTPNESCKDILDGIAHQHAKILLESGGDTCCPVQEKSAKTGLLTAREGWSIFKACSPAIVAICTQERILRGSMRIQNPMFQLFEQAEVTKSVLDGGKTLALTYSNSPKKGPCCVIRVSGARDTMLDVELHFTNPISGEGQTILFHYFFEPQRPLCNISEMPSGKDSAVKDFYRSLWLREPLAAVQGLHDEFTSAPTKLTPDLLQQITSAITKAETNYFANSLKSHEFPLDAMIMVAWDAVVKPLLIDGVDGDLLSLVHLSNESKYEAGATPLAVGDTVSCCSTIRSLTIDGSGKTVQVRVLVKRRDQHIATILSAFLFRGSFFDYSPTFQRSDEPGLQVTLSSPVDLAVMRNRPWLRLDTKQDLLGQTLIFNLENLCTWRDANTYKSLKSTGTVFLKDSRGHLEPVGSVHYEAAECTANPVMDFLLRVGRRPSDEIPLENPGWDGLPHYEVRVPVDNTAYSIVSRDCNPIHTAPIFASWTGLPGTIAHGMYTSAIVRNMVEYIAAKGDRRRFRSFETKFTGMVLPGDNVSVHIKHTAMLNGAIVLDVRATKAASGEEVLHGKAVVEQEPTSFIFTGQGSQVQGMGMSLYESSDVAREVFDEADAHLYETYGWSILDIIRNNPKTMTIHFGGKRGRQIRKNYLALTIQDNDSDVSKPILQSLTEESPSYTFSEPRGLLLSTQFAQPAITLVAKATFLHLKSKGIVPADANFAGHSLGEYCALSAFTEFIPFHALLGLVFYRGLTMQIAMDRDEHGSTGFSMAAVNPERVGKFFDEKALRAVLQFIANRSGRLLEIVNFNVIGKQYVCAGDLTNLHTLTTVLNHLAAQQQQGRDLVGEFLDALVTSSRDAAATTLGQVLVQHMADSNTMPKPVELVRGRATIPLQGIDVPFHSSFLRPNVGAYRKYLQERVHVEDIVPERFIGKWVPNVMAAPLQLDKAYLEEAARLTGSTVLANTAVAVA